MGNYAACKKYTQKEKNQFTLLTRSNFSLIAKNCVGLGIGTLQLTETFNLKNPWYGILTKRGTPLSKFQIRFLIDYLFLFHTFCS